MFKVNNKDTRTTAAMFDVLSLTLSRKMTAGIKRDQNDKKQTAKTSKFIQWVKLLTFVV